MTPTASRDIVFRKARTDIAAALEVARSIRDPWFAAQALAAATRFSSEDALDALADEALAKAREAEDLYHVVGASAWTVRALIERGRAERATHEIEALLAAAAGIAQPVRRMDALFLLWEAAFPFHGSARKGILQALISTARTADSWKPALLMRDAVLMIARERLEDAEALVVSVPDGKYRRQTVDRLRSLSFARPRHFFNAEPES
jgi:hypothetical protein